jgi:hypothetical protein
LHRQCGKGQQKVRAEHVQSILSDKRSGAVASGRKGTIRQKHKPNQVRGSSLPFQWITLGGFTADAQKSSFQTVEVAVPRQVFAEILLLKARLRAPRAGIVIRFRSSSESSTVWTGVLRPHGAQVYSCRTRWMERSWLHNGRVLGNVDKPSCFSPSRFGVRMVDEVMP